VLADPLEIAAQNASLGLPVAAGTRFRFVKRLIARAIWLTNRQQVRYNHELLAALRATNLRLDELGARTASEIRNSAEELLEVLGATNQRLDELGAQTASDLQHSVVVLRDELLNAHQRSIALLEASLRSEIASTLLENARRDGEIGQLRADLAGLLLADRSLESVGQAAASSHDATETRVHRGGLGDSGLSLAAFAERFRGPFETIVQRQASLVKLVSNVPGPILDLGSGRGEWLELLAGEHLNASGIEADPASVRACRERDLKVIEGEALAHLQGLPAGSLGAVSAFHLLEHLTFNDCVEVIREAHRVLLPGGRLIIETPNTSNLLVGAATFRLDPGHIQPLHPLLLDFVLVGVGFSDVVIEAINPPPSLRVPDGGPTELADLVDAVNTHLFSGLDTLATGIKPAAIRT
jgi:SAM-dependent methyltransferase